jgi:cystine transport system ATP-binding protein
VIEAGPAQEVFGRPADERTKQFISTLTAQHPDVGMR